MEVIIDGIKYIPAKEAIANRDAVIRGLMESFWGSLKDGYNEDELCSGVWCVITDDDRYSNSPTVQEVADLISEFSK